MGERRGWQVMIDYDERVLSVHEFSTLQFSGCGWHMVTVFEGEEPERSPVWEDRSWHILLGSDGRALQALKDGDDLPELDGGQELVVASGSLWALDRYPEGCDGELDCVALAEDNLANALAADRGGEDRESLACTVRVFGQHALRTLGDASLRRAPGVSIARRRRRALRAMASAEGLVEDMDTAHRRAEERVQALLESLARDAPSTAS
jgi:hypothetical protein